MNLQLMIKYYYKIHVDKKNLANVDETSANITISLHLIVFKHSISKSIVQCFSDLYRIGL